MTVGRATPLCPSLLRPFLPSPAGDKWTHLLHLSRLLTHPLSPPRSAPVLLPASQPAQRLALTPSSSLTCAPLVRVSRASRPSFPNRGLVPSIWYQFSPPSGLARCLRSRSFASFCVSWRELPRYLLPRHLCLVRVSGSLARRLAQTRPLSQDLPAASAACNPALYLWPQREYCTRIFRYYTHGTSSCLGLQAINVTPQQPRH